MEEKGIDVLLEAWNLLRDSKGWFLELVGEGVLRIITRLWGRMCKLRTS